MLVLQDSENIPENESCLFVSNHQSNVDFAVQMVYLKKPKGFIAKVSIEKIPIVSSWMKEMNSLFLDRSNPKQSARVILDGIKLLKSGKSLVIYPEGTRSKSNKIGEFKDGAFKLATKAGVKIVPITINGTYKALEENNSKIKPADVTLIIHTPISTCDLSKDEIKELPEKVFKIISSSL